MRTSLLIAVLTAVVAVTCLTGAGTLAQQSQPAQIDWDYARTLLQKERNGQALTAQENAYLDNAKKVRSASQGPSSRPAQANRPPADTKGLVPLDEMAAPAKYKDQDGGLYGGGSNEPPKALRDAALKAAGAIVPLDAEGKPSANGKVVLISIGMSNTTQEFSKFKELADKDPARNPGLVIVDGAQGGKDSRAWNTPQSDPWTVLDKRIQAAGVSPQQVQVAWLKQAMIAPANLGEFPTHAKSLQADIEKIIQIAKSKFPNLKIVYLSSRIYAGYASTQLNPEPYAYESVFSVRWVIQGQLTPDGQMKAPADAKAAGPVVLWGPYLWGNGVTPRKSDGLIWKVEDLGPDGTHPSPATGREKVARLLLDFLKKDVTATGWFLKTASSMPAVKTGG